MEDRPGGWVAEGCLKHVELNRPGLPNVCVENDQHRQQLHEEAQTEKTGNGEMNGTPVEREETSSARVPAEYLHSCSSRQLETSNLKPKPPVKTLATHAKGSSNSHFKNSMNCRDDKPSELKTCESKCEATALPNGVVLLKPGLYANGYSGSGFESGYITPKKRWAQRSARAEQGVTGQEKAMLHTAMVPNKPESEPLACEPAEIRTGTQSPTSMKGVSPVDQVSELQCKNSEGKASAGLVKKLEDRSGKAKLIPTKEDSWTLFKPPPVFPVDNSSAKTVPKISYASKVKENLNKAAVQVAEDTLPHQYQAPAKVSQVPMSAVKTITSPSFINGPLSEEGNNCPLPAPLFTPTACTALAPVSPSQKGQGESSASSNCINTPGVPSITVRELRKPSLLGISNMQPGLPSARQGETCAAKTNPKALVDIFQNQWGLSFINEPSAGPGVGAAVVVPPARKGQIMEFTFQGGGSAALPLKISTTSNLRTDKPLFPMALEKDKQIICHSLKTVGKSGPLLTPGLDEQKGQGPDRDTQMDEAGSGCAVVAPGAELPSASPIHPVAAVSMEPGHSKDCHPKTNRGAFDLRAAVIYHINEVEYIWSLHKQDPKRVVLYDQTKDGPVQLCHD